MNEEYNPYNNPPEPQPPQTQKRAEPQQSVQQRFYPPYQPINYSQQAMYGRNPAPPRNSDGTARAMGMVSFIVGCFALIAASMIFFNFRSSINTKFEASFICGMMISLPGVIFGVISLMKRTKKKIFPILGIAFSGVLLVCLLITYFVMVNTAPDLNYHI